MAGVYCLLTNETKNKLAKYFLRKYRVIAGLCINI